MDTTSVSLLKRLRKPTDKEAWDRFAELYTPLLYRWANRLGLQEADAEDLVQEVMKLLIDKLPDFVYQRQNGRFRGWLKRVLHNKYVDIQRKRREALLPEGQDIAAKDEKGQDALSFIDREYTQALVRRALEVMKAEFHDTTWKACWMFVVEDKPAADVAAELNTSVAVVWASKSRIMRRLRQSLQGLL